MKTRQKKFLLIGLIMVSFLPLLIEWTRIDYLGVYGSITPLNALELLKPYIIFLFAILFAVLLLALKIKTEAKP